ncbi:aromatic-ring-hydroxylating dioxygenase subunit beta [bacterium]|nr:aromatic-ring-hydroxylating dioxygenase subunit beta [bacterium]
MAVDSRQIEQFIYREARLADENAYDEWLAMWADEALYWVPANLDDPDPSKHISTIYDNRSHLEQRIKRLKSGMAHAQAPVSRMRRVVSNIEIAERPDGIVEAQSNFVLANCAAAIRTSSSAARSTGCGPTAPAVTISSKRKCCCSTTTALSTI